MATPGDASAAPAGEDTLSKLLSITPETTLQFYLSKDEGGEASTPKCTMTLKHPGGNQDSVAFKARGSENNYKNLIFFPLFVFFFGLTRI
jgi:hypothetical protein